MPVHEEIVALLTLPESGTGAATLARIEDTLTEGYAEALSLEAERLRIERRLGEIARTVNGGPPPTDELASLSERLEAADGEIAKLRGLLAPLHDRARVLRRNGRKP